MTCRQSGTQGLHAVRRAGQQAGRDHSLYCHKLRRNPGSVCGRCRSSSSARRAPGAPWRRRRHPRLQELCQQGQQAAGHHGVLQLLLLRAAQAGGHCSGMPARRHHLAAAADAATAAAAGIGAQVKFWGCGFRQQAAQQAQQVELPRGAAAGRSEGARAQVSTAGGAMQKPGCLLSPQAERGRAHTSHPPACTSHLTQGPASCSWQPGSATTGSRACSAAMAVRRSPPASCMPTCSSCTSGGSAPASLQHEYAPDRQQQANQRMLTTGGAHREAERQAQPGSAAAAAAPAPAAHPPDCCCILLAVGSILG